MSAGGVGCGAGECDGALSKGAALEFGVMPTRRVLESRSVLHAGHSLD